MGAPGVDGDNVVIDFATTAVSFGKVDFFNIPKFVVKLYFGVDRSFHEERPVYPDRVGPKQRWKRRS